MQNLVIVESPTKARTLAKYLGHDYEIQASMGHVRDLPKSTLGVDVDRNFEPKYIIPKGKASLVNSLKKLAEKAQVLWLATDPDREGEAIAWHLKELLGTKVVSRVVFHEITPEAIKEAFANPRRLDQKLVDAQQARRILDRLVGYRLSPLLWKKVKSGLSAGRVQSVALRLVVEREREIEAFKPVEYWSIEAVLKTREAEIRAALVEQSGKKLVVNNKQQADQHLEVLKSAQYQVKKITKKELKRQPHPPFTTSTLQQAANNVLGMTAKKTMAIAQKLYEHGLITYMRTDSVNLSAVALSVSRSFIEKSYGKDYLFTKPRLFKTKSKLAQEAHEAIRPTNLGQSFDELKTMEGMTRDHFKLYELIWKRMVASQMSEAILDQTSVDIKANDYLFKATGNVIKFEGWMKIYEKAKTFSEHEAEADEQHLPQLNEGEILKLLSLDPRQHFTQPTPRYNDASLIKKLEELGIGRPSTYAPTLSTIQDRYYVEKQERRFFPTALGIAVIDFLVKNFPDIVDYAFTAQLENELDEIASGERQWQPTLQQFYGPFEKKVESTAKTAEKVQIETEELDRDCPTCGKKLIVKYGRFGKFIACSGFPECKFTENLEEKLDIPCPLDGGEIVFRKTHKGRPFYGCKNYPNCKFASWTKPNLENIAKLGEASKQQVRG